MSRVVVVKVPSDLSRSILSREQYRQLLAAGICLLTGEKGSAEGLRRMLGSGPVGMKTNCLARKANSTPVALADALADLLIGAGCKPGEIIVWDRTSRELAGAGYTLNAAGTTVKCLGTDANGVGYSAEFYSSGEVNSLVSRILTEMVEANINLPILKDHSIAGLSAGMKNLYGVINNPNKYHADGCNPYCAQVSALGPVRSKNKLTIVDAVRVQYQGGPGFVSDYVAAYGGLILGTDPVAVDRVGLEIVDHLRAQNGLPSLAQAKRPVKYLDTAQSLGLGCADFSKIDLQVVQLDANARQQTVRLF